MPPTIAEVKGRLNFVWGKACVARKTCESVSEAFETHVEYSRSVSSACVAYVLLGHRRAT